MNDKKDKISAPETALNKRDLAAMLRFQIEAGVTDLLSETPVNRFNKAHQAIEQSASETTPQAPPGMQESPPPALEKSAPGDSLARARPPVSISPEDVNNAITQAQAAESLDALQKAVETFEGCPLKQAARTTVFCDGNNAARLMLIGEAPGRDEDREGRPFVGASGQLLDLMMRHIGFTRETMYITNIVPWRPPGNRAPKPEEAAVCLPFVKRHIELVKPDILVLIGGTSAKELIQTTDGISKLRGQWHDIDVNGTRYKSLPLFHPAYLLRNPARKAETWQDLLKLKHAFSSQGET
ncbi:MAG: uracil-DNA glycosylase family protein [Parvibaculales bacterium]